MKRLNIFAILFITVSSLSAQNDLKRAEFREFNIEAGHQIERLKNYLDILGATDKNNRVKEVYHRQTVLLFTEDGKDKYVQVSFGEDGPITNRSLDEYLRRLRNLPGTNVEITKVETIYISNFRKVRNQYEAVANIFQHSRKLDESGQVTYSEHFIETKNIVIINGDIDVDNNNNNKRIVLLGNIEVVETRQ